MHLAPSTMTAAVTGASGFIGGRLVEALRARGDQVTAVVRDYGRAARPGRLGVPIVRADIRDVNAVTAAVDGADVVFHCAYCWDNDERAERADNVAGSVNVGRAVMTCGVPRLVHVSTMAVYGQNLPATVDEDTPMLPTTPYGRTKLEIELALRELAAGSGMDLRVVRATKVYGPYDLGFTVRTIRSLLARRLLLIEGGSGIVAPTYVDNLVHGLILAAETTTTGGTHVIADGLNLRWRDFYAYFTAMTGVSPYGNYTRGGGVPPGMDEPPPPGDLEYRDFMRSGAYSIARAERELGYRPVVPIDLAMARTEAWLRFARILDPNVSPETRGSTLP